MLASADGRAALREAARRRQGARRDRELGDLRDQRDVRAGEQAVRGPLGRPTSPGAGQGPARRAPRHRRRRRPDDRLRVPARPERRRGLAGARARCGATPRTIVGASDAGAHLDFLATFNYSTAMLGKAVRERQHAAHRRGDPHAHRRSRAAVRAARNAAASQKGWHADIVVLDPTTIGPQPVRMRFDLPDRRAAPVRRCRRHRPRARQRHRDRRPRRVHRRAAGHVVAFGPRHRDRHRVIAAPVDAMAPPRRIFARIWRRGRSVGPVAQHRRRARPPRARRDARPRASITDVLAPPRHDDASAPRPARSPTPTSRSTTPVESASSACSRATSGSIPTSVREASDAMRRAATPLAPSDGRARPPRRAHPARGPAAPPVHRARRWREAARRPPRRPAAVRRRGPGARRRSTSSSTNISSRCSTSVCSRCSASRGTRRPRCSRS